MFLKFYQDRGGFCAPVRGGITSLYMRPRRSIRVLVLMKGTFSIPGMPALLSCEANSSVAEWGRVDFRYFAVYAQLS